MSVADDNILVTSIESRAVIKVGIHRLICGG